MRSWLLVAVAAAQPSQVSGWPWPDHTFHAHIWRPSQPGFEFPELAEASGLRDYLAQRSDFGIALAGGGTRGLAFGHGAVRSLRKAGILSKAKYMSTSSGSIWFAIPLYYQNQDPIEEFLGETLPLDKQTPEALISHAAGSAFSRLSLLEDLPKGLDSPVAEDSAEFGRSRAATALEEVILRLKKSEVGDLLPPCLKDMDLCSCIVNKVLPDSSLRELWNLFSSTVFLHPFGLAQHGSLHCHASQLESLRARTDNGTTIYVSRDKSQELPYLLSQATILAPLTGRDGHPVAFFPLEQTPIYSGTPASFTGERAFPYKGLGDMYQESYSWPGAALDPVPASASGEVRIERGDHLFNAGLLAEWAAMVTTYFADFQVKDWVRELPKCVVTVTEEALPHATVFSPLDTDDKGVPRPKLVPVGDAGIYDDLGHLPLLRRRVSKIVIYDSSAVHDNRTGPDMEDLCQMTYTRAAFGQPGCLSTPIPAGAAFPNMPPNSSAVFAVEEFEPFWSRVRALHKAGKPVVIRDKFTVVDNAYLGITGGWKAEVVWILGVPVDEWRAQLPSRTSSVLRRFFPNYYALEMVTKMEISLASQMASWLTEQVAIKEIRAMLEETLPETKASEPGERVVVV